MARFSGNGALMGILRWRVPLPKKIFFLDHVTKGPGAVIVLCTLKEA